MSSYSAGWRQKCCWWVLQAEESPSPTLLVVARVTATVH